MKSCSLTQISDNVFEAEINYIPYTIYRVKPRLYRVEKSNKVFFNITAYDINKVCDIISRMDYDDNKTKGKHLKDFILNMEVEKNVNTPKITIEKE